MIRNGSVWSWDLSSPQTKHKIGKSWLSWDLSSINWLKIITKILPELQWNIIFKATPQVYHVADFEIVFVLRRWFEHVRKLSRKFLKKTYAQKSYSELFVFSWISSTKNDIVHLQQNTVPMVGSDQMWKTNVLPMHVTKPHGRAGCNMGWHTIHFYTLWNKPLQGSRHKSTMECIWTFLLVAHIETRGT